MLSDHQLWEVWEYALKHMQEMRKGKNENDKVFLARCWEAGLMQVLKKEGLCLKKESSGS